MAEVSFQRSTATPVDASIVSETPAPTVSAPVAAIPMAPALPVAVLPSAGAVAQNAPTQFDDDDLGFEDVRLPRVNVVQKVGGLSNLFEDGEIVLNQELVIHTPAFIHPSDPKLNTPGTGLLNIVVVGFRKRQYAEKIDGGARGMLLNDESEIPKNNGTLDWNEWQASLTAAKVPGGAPAKRYFERLATAMVLIERPAHIPDENHMLFPYDCEGKYYALVLWGMKGAAYTHAAKGVFFTQKKIGSCRRVPGDPNRVGYLTHGWTLTTRLEAFKSGNFAWVPVPKAGPMTSDAFKAFAREIIG